MLTYDLDRRGKLARYDYLYRCIREDILAGRLTAGEKLPSKRSLASHLQTAVITVQNAYAQLEAEGYLYTREKRGYYVADVERHPAAPGRALARSAPQPQRSWLLDLSSGGSGTEDFPFSVWAKLMRRVLSEEGEALLRATPPNGADALRRAIAQHLYRFRGISAAPEQIVVGAGTEYLYNLIVQLLGREAVYGVEDPGYSKAARIYALGGARTAPVLVDEGGVSLRSLEMSDAQILHTSPNHQFPTGAVTPIGRRQSLLRWAEAREGRYIIEDDYDSEFRFTLRPIPTLQSIDRAGRVIYVNTFSRTLAPSLRISYMVLPKSLTERYRAQLGFYSSTVPAMEQYTLARFLDEGYFEAHINRMRKSYRAQRDAVIDTILQSPLGEHCRVSGEDAGLHFLLTIDTKCTDHVLRTDAEGRGVRLSFLSDFALRPGSAPQHTLVIHYPGIDLGRLRSALSILEALLYFRDWKYKGRK